MDFTFVSEKPKEDLVGYVLSLVEKDKYVLALAEEDCCYELMTPEGVWDTKTHTTTDIRQAAWFGSLEAVSDFRRRRSSCGINMKMWVARPFYMNASPNIVNDAKLNAALTEPGSMFDFERLNIAIPKPVITGHHKEGLVDGKFTINLKVDVDRSSFFDWQMYALKVMQDELRETLANLEERIEAAKEEKERYLDYLKNKSS